MIAILVWHSANFVKHATIGHANAWMTPMISWKENRTIGQVERNLTFKSVYTAANNAGVGVPGFMFWYNAEGKVFNDLVLRVGLLWGVIV